MISDNDDKFEEIPRSRLLSSPKIILYKLVYEYFGEMRGKTLKKILKRDSSQVSQNVTKLVNNGYIIKVNKNRKELRIQATKSGTIHIQEHLNKSFRDITNYLNFINGLEGIEEKTHRKIELVNSVLQHQDSFEEVLKKIKIEKKRKKGEHYQQIYDRVESGKIKDNLMEKVFDFCNKNPTIKLAELQVNFKEGKPQTIKTYYNLWFKITLEKSK